jgi:hypothetical protein
MLALATTTGWTGQHRHQSAELLRWASSNVHNLSTAPVRALLLSAIFLPDGDWPAALIAVLVVLVPLERRLGSLLTAAIFGSAHLLATALTEGAVWLDVRAGRLATSAQFQDDVGVSYGLCAAVAALLYFVPRPLRGYAALVLVGASGLAAAIDANLASAGHLLSLSIGLLWWPALSLRAAARTRPR